MQHPDLNQEPDNPSSSTSKINTDSRSVDLVPPEIFRAYDIRGKFPEQLNCENIYLIGRAIGTLAKQRNIHRLLVARDGRTSSPALITPLISGLLHSGCDVVNLGMVPTPLLNFACHNTDCTSGLMLTASHNPANYNGVKIVLNRAPLCESDILELYRDIQHSNYLHTNESKNAGTLSELSINMAYIEKIKSTVSLLRPLKLVIDCANAVPGIIAPLLFSQLGCEVNALFCDIDGRFPNHHPDPTIADNLKLLADEVIATSADVGLAFDGDGDRLGIVCNFGNAVDTDDLLLLLADAILPHYPGQTAVFDIKCSNRLTDCAKKHGLTAVRARSGHSFMKQKMAETGAPFGGEYAAHIFIKDRWYGFDDGLYAAARLLEILAADSTPLSDRLAQLPSSHCSPEIKLAVSDEEKFALMEALLKLASFPGATINTLDGLRVEYTDRWGLIRASNTSPALLLRFEANSLEGLAAIKSEFLALLKKSGRDLNANFS